MRRRKIRSKKYEKKLQTNQESYVYVFYMTINFILYELHEFIRF